MSAPTIHLAECAAECGHDETAVLSAHRTMEGARDEARQHCRDEGMDPDLYAVVTEVVLFDDDGGAPPIERTLNGLDETEAEDIALDVEVTFEDTKGLATVPGFWEYALDYFIQYDNLNSLVANTDYWHSRDDGMLTGTTFRFDVDGMKPDAPRQVAVSGEAVRHLATEHINGDYQTFSDDGCIVSRAGFRMVFKDGERALPVLRHIKELYGEARVA